MSFRIHSALSTLAFCLLAVLLAAPVRAQITSGGVYTLACKTGGLALDNEGATSVGNAVWQWGLSGNSNQQWQINKLPNGYYTIICLTSGMALDSGHVFTNGEQAFQNLPVQGSTDQEWTITSVGGGYYTVVSASTGLALDNGGYTTSGSNVHYWTPQPGNTNQQWQFNLVETLPIASGSIYTLKCNTGGLYLDNGGSATVGATTDQWSGSLGNPNQEWQFNVQPNGTYCLICVTSGMALDNEGGTSNGTPVHQWTPSFGNTNQQWTVTSAGNGYYTLISKTSNLALDNDGGTTNGATVWQWAFQSGNANQQWAIMPVQIGANTPFIEYEAEAGALGGSANVVAVTSPSTTQFSSPQLEASGHAYVNLANTGDSVTWTNNTGQNITFINLRYSIPDSSGGGGITSTINLYVNGAFRQALNVNSQQTYEYETSSSYGHGTENPSSGNAHYFWDETHAFISGAAIAPGSTISIKKDAGNTASYYNIDLIDLENPPAALSQPANSLSITSYGAIANNPNVDSTSAIQNCINAAQSSGKGVWVPPGTYYLNTTNNINNTGVVMSGAGMWYSTIYANAPSGSSGVAGPWVQGGGTFANLMFDGNGKSVASTTGGIGAYVGNWTINSVWVQHLGCGVWGLGSNSIVENCRINNTGADGININNTANTTCNNTTVINNFVRGSGDDGIAINDTDGTNRIMQNSKIVQNTTVAPYWANNMGIYGGNNDMVENNLFHDSVKQIGLSIGFLSGNAPLQSATVAGNTVIRGGGYGYTIPFSGISFGTNTGPPFDTSWLTNVTLCGNMDVGAMFNGVDIELGQSLALNNNTVVAPGLNGYVVDSAGVGNASLTNDWVFMLPIGKSTYANNAGSGFSATVTGGNL